MATPIYHFFRATPTEAWYQLSKDEQSARLEKVRAALAQVGGKSTIICDCRWASEAWSFFGVEEFPNVEALQRHAQLLEELNVYRYVRGESLIGTAMGSAG